jgi:EAL domain-containing protein (putative c-di-GMP-specific phosphodiesterase class I)
LRSSIGHYKLPKKTRPDVETDSSAVPPLHNEADQRLVQTAVSIARSLGAQTIAEGAEDEETLNMLREFGVDFAQGYHLGRPLAPLKNARGGNFGRGGVRYRPESSDRKLQLLPES